MFLVLENDCVPAPVPTGDIADIGEIVSWYEERRYESGFLPQAESRQNLERCTGKYLQKLSLAAEAKFWWLMKFLPEALAERLVANQRAWLVSRRAHFALLNTLHGLLGGGNKPFDAYALLLAQAEFVKARGLELEYLYAEFNSRWRTAKVAAIE